MMENPGASNTSNPLQNQAAPDQAQGPQQGNPLARIAPQMGGQPQMPVPNRAQTVAAVQRFGAVQAALRPILSDPSLGKENIRPELLDAGSKLLGSKMLSLPELMNEISKFPDDVLKQKEFIQNLYNSAQQAEASILNQHGAAIAAGKLPPDGGPEYDAANHAGHMDSLLGQYKR